MNDKVLLSVVVPCFNEEEVIGMTHNRIVGALGNNDNFDLEIVYVNDGSDDKTLDLIIGLTQQSKSARVVNLARNFGHQLAITAGMESATGDVIAVIDADLQDPPEVILEMYEEWNKGFDIVYGIRQNRRENIFMRTAWVKSSETRAMSDQKVRAWLISYPGLVEGSSPADAMNRAHARSGIDCSVDDFKAALWRYGFMVTQVRNTYRLALPTRFFGSRRRAFRFDRFFRVRDVRQKTVVAHSGHGNGAGPSQPSCR